MGDIGCENIKATSTTGYCMQKSIIAIGNILCGKLLVSVRNGLNALANIFSIYQGQV